MSDYPSASSFFSGCDDVIVSSDASAAVTISDLDETALDRLLDSEPHHMPLPDYLRRSLDLTARQDSLNWILKVHSHYHFRPVTAFLSVNYFDRFLSSNPFPEGCGWAFQLLSVTCLSLAAKMEEPYVPLLLDLQLFEPRFVFDPKTIQRMELWVMSNLNWRLRSVTPFDYVDHFVSQLPSSSGSNSDVVLLSCSDLLLKTIRVIDFLDFPPSAFAAAAVITAAGVTVDLPETFYERANREMVRSCHQLMEQYLVDTCPSAENKDRLAEPSEPSSPVGVLDAAACGSCDTRSRYNPPSGSESSQAETQNMRPRSSGSDVQQQQT